MGFRLRQLWSAPEINPYNKKARWIPVLNLSNKYGRVFFFSYMGFFIAFWSWYAFPPLLSISIKTDLHLSRAEVANSNIISLIATLLVRIIAGPMCDHIGPRLTFVALLIVGAIPTALAGTVKDAMGLYFIRFFVGILGGTFVPCQVWTTAFFDKNIVGTANALAGGWGNAGGGITYFAMPAIYDSLMHDRGLSSHIAWRVSFLVPFILIIVTAIAMVLLTEDTPTGQWSERNAIIVQRNHPSIIPIAGNPTDTPDPTHFPIPPTSSKEKNSEPSELETAAIDIQIVDTTQHEVIIKPTLKETVKILTSPQTLTLSAAYFCSFGGELAINSILGAYYFTNIPSLTQTTSGRWAAMFGLLNVVMRPLGGVVGDAVYRLTRGNLWAKKGWVHFCGVVTGGLLIAIGVLESRRLDVLVGLVAGLAVFMEAGNGAVFAVVPHVHPSGNGVLSGIVGAAGNLGGVVFAIVFRYNHRNFARGFWIMGVVTIVLNLCLVWVRPVPKGQIGGW